MEQFVNEALIKSGIELSSLAIKGTATLVNSKIQSMKSEKDVQTLRNGYDEIINELLIERDQAIRIAQSYKEEYEKVNIDDDDIEYLNNSVKQAINLLSKFSSITEEQNNSFEQITEILNKDTLKTMQLLGFNYKQAIGEPLTEICADAIRTKLKVTNKRPSQVKKK